MDEQQPPGSETAVIGSRLRIGAQLAAARTAAGLDLTDIARDTRVPLRHLRAIEADAHDSLPALPYAIGFVKSLARAVGVDAEAAAVQFRAETTKTAHVPAPVTLEPLDERRLPPQGVVTASIAALVVLVGGIIAWSAGAFDPATPPPPVVVAAPPAPGPAAPAIAPPIEAAAAPGIAVPPLAAGAGGAPPPAGAAPLPPATIRGPSPVPAGPSSGVALTATEDVWVKIYDRARNTVKSGVIKAGERYAVPADPPGLLLWTGKPGMLTVTVGNRVIPPLGGPVETVKDVSLLPADLLARTAAMPPPAPAR